MPELNGGGLNLDRVIEELKNFYIVKGPNNRGEYTVDVKNGQEILNIVGRLGSGAAFGMFDHEELERHKVNDDDIVAVIVFFGSDFELLIRESSHLWGAIKDYYVSAR